MVPDVFEMESWLQPQRKWTFSLLEHIYALAGRQGETSKRGQK